MPFEYILNRVFLIIQIHESNLTLTSFPTQQDTHNTTKYLKDSLNSILSPTSKW